MSPRQGYALLCRAVAGRAQKAPHEGDAVAFGDHSKHENVDVGFADLTVGPVYTEIPAVWISDQRHHDPDAPVIGQEHLLEEALQAAIG